MSHFQFICRQHIKWVSEHPREAFCRVQEMQQLAEVLLQKQEFDKAIPFLGTALETAELIFDQRLESPELTTRLTALSIMLANAYSAINENGFAKSLLSRITRKMRGAVSCGEDYQTKIAFYKHCIQAIQEAKQDLLEPQILTRQPLSLVLH